MEKNTFTSYLLTFAVIIQLFGYNSIAAAESVNTVSNQTSQSTNPVALTINAIQKTPNAKLLMKPPIVKISTESGKTLLSWDAVAGAKSYKVKRGSRPGELVEIASDIQENKFIDNDALVNGTYYYSVTAVGDSSTESSNSNILLKMSIPETPVLLGGWEKGYIRLKWSKSTDQEGYILYRSTGKISTSGGAAIKGPYIPITATLDNQFIDKNVNAKSEYYYTVRATNTVGQSGSSYELKVANDTVYNNDFIPYLDGDNDGLDNEDELTYGTDKDNMDTDRDGLSDGYEVNVSGTNPVIADSDGDGILDGAEMALGTNPLVKDIAQDVTKYAKSTDGSTEVIAKGKDNLAVTPVQIRTCKNMPCDAIPGKIGNLQEVYFGGLSGMQTKIIFHYSGQSLGTAKENELGIFKVDTANKKLIPLKWVSLDKTAKTVSANLQSSGVYMLGNTKMPVKYGDLDILFAMDNSSFLNATEYENKRLDVINQFLDSITQNSIRFGILSFSDTVNLQQKLTANKKTIQDLLKISNTDEAGDSASGEINLSDELAQINQYFGGNNSIGKSVFMFTGKKNTGDRNKILDIANILAKKNIKLFPMAYGQNIDKELLQTIAGITGGSYFNLDNDGKYTSLEVADQLKFVFDSLAGEMGSIMNENAGTTNSTPLANAIPVTQDKVGNDFPLAQNTITREGLNKLNGNFVLKQEDILPDSKKVIMERYYNSNYLEKSGTNIGQGWRTGYDSKLKSVSNAAIVKADTSNLIQDLSKNVKVVGTVSKGEILKYIKSSWKYVLVGTQSGKQGYILSKDIQYIKTGIEVAYSSGTHLIFELNRNKITAPSGCTDKLVKTKAGYDLIKKDNTKYQYEKLPSGKLVSMAKPNGSTYKIFYTGEQISSVTVNGDTFKFAYNSDKSLQCINGNNNSSINYQYGSGGVLGSIYYTKGNMITYNYKKTGNQYKLETVLDADGKAIMSNKYDLKGRLVSSSDANGAGVFADYRNQIMNKNAVVYNYNPAKDLGKLENGMGTLSEKYESRGAGGAACIANNAQDAGGKSYGAWQFASAVGTADAFLKWLKNDFVSNNSGPLTSVADSVYGKLSNAKALDNGFGNNFDTAWKEIASNDYQNFLELQSRYIKIKYYDRADAALKKYYGFDVSGRSRALKSVLFSTSVQHGVGVTSTEVYTYTGSVPIFRKALEVCLGLPEGKLVGITPGTYDFSKITDEELINAVYDERSKCMLLEDMQSIVVKLWGRADASKVFPITNLTKQKTKQIAEQYGIENLAMYHFNANGPDVQASVFRRLNVNERADALRMLENPKVLP